MCEAHLGLLSSAPPAQVHLTRAEAGAACQSRLQAIVRRGWCAQQPAALTIGLPRQRCHPAQRMCVDGWDSVQCSTRTLAQPSGLVAARQRASQLSAVGAGAGDCGRRARRGWVACTNPAGLRPSPKWYPAAANPPRLPPPTSSPGLAGPSNLLPEAIAWKVQASCTRKAAQGRASWGWGGTLQS